MERGGQASIEFEEMLLVNPKTIKFIANKSELPSIGFREASNGKSNLIPVTSIKRQDSGLSSSGLGLGSISFIGEGITLPLTLTA